MSLRDTRVCSRAETIVNGKEKRMRGNADKKQRRKRGEEKQRVSTQQPRGERRRLLGWNQ